MHFVDTADQYLAYYPFIRKTVKWHKNVFFFLSIFCIQKAATQDITRWNITEGMF
jgi:hypothetical protein